MSCLAESPGLACLRPVLCLVPDPALAPALRPRPGGRGLPGRLPLARKRPPQRIPLRKRKAERYAPLCTRYSLPWEMVRNRRSCCKGEEEKPKSLLKEGGAAFNFAPLLPASRLLKGGARERGKLLVIAAVMQFPCWHLACIPFPPARISLTSFLILPLRKACLFYRRDFRPGIRPRLSLTCFFKA